MGGKLTAVQSSHLRAVDYDWGGTLTIKFHSGGVYEYYGVPESEYSGLLNAVRTADISTPESKIATASAG